MGREHEETEMTKVKTEQLQSTEGHLAPAASPQASAGREDLQEPLGRTAMQAPELRPG